MKHVMLLGDSIRRSYQQQVTELLSGKAVVSGTKENNQFSLYTLSSLGRWIEELGKPDIVHWNNGIHDVGHNPNRRPVQFPIDDYLFNLRKILDQLKKTNAVVIWATTTPVHPNRPLSIESWSWRNSEIAAYNEGAMEIMNSEGIPVTDLHAIVAADYDRYLREDMLHLSEEGQRACSKAVAESVTRYL
jgi:isoamyl acetate esterase